MFTSDDRVFFFFMLFFLCFGHASATFLALVVLPCATDLMHSEFGHFDVLAAEVTSFGF